MSSLKFIGTYVLRVLQLRSLPQRNAGANSPITSIPEEEAENCDKEKCNENPAQDSEQEKLDSVSSEVLSDKKIGNETKDNIEYGDNGAIPEVDPGGSGTDESLSAPDILNSTSLSNEKTGPGYQQGVNNTTRQVGSDRNVSYGIQFFTCKLTRLGFFQKTYPKNSKKENCLDVSGIILVVSYALNYKPVLSSKTYQLGKMSCV